MKALAWVVFGGLCIFAGGCFAPAKMTHYITGTTEFYEFVERYPEANDVKLGAIYRLKKDLLLMGTSVRGRQSLSIFGFAGEPKSPDEYWSDPGEWSDAVKGVVEEGTLFETRFIEKYLASQPSSRASWTGVALEIVDGPYRGEVIAPLGRAFAGIGTDFAVPDPEYFEKVANATIVPAKGQR